MNNLYETSRERIQRFYPYLTDEELDETMLVIKNFKRNDRSAELTREDLLIIIGALLEKANEINASSEDTSKFTAKQVFNAINKITVLFG